MSLVNGLFFFWLLMGLCLSLFLFLFFVLIMHFLMPQAVLDRYWKEPHFRPFELMLFSGWSFFAPWRTLMFMWTFMFPRLGARRGILEPHRLVPRWYRIVSIALCTWAIIAATGVIAISIGFYVYLTVTGNPRMVWNDHLLLAIGIGCFAFVAIRQWRINKRDDKAKQARSDRRKKDEPA